MQLPISTYDNEDPSSTARLVNCYAESLPNDARSPVILRRCPGMTNVSDQRNIDGGPIAMHRIPGTDEIVIAFSTGRLNVLDAAGTVVQSGTVVPDQEYVDMAADASSVIWVTNPLAYRTTAGGSTSQINDADFTARGAAEVEFLDNYFLFREPGTARFFGSDVGAPTAYTSTSFATAENQGDLLVGMKATNANLLLFGEETIEIWDAVGGSGFPFRRIINGAIDKGCVNGRTIAEIDDQVFWVADDRTVRMLQGMEPVKISNFAIDRYLQSYDGITAGVAFTYTWNGHNYYVLKYPTRCFVYDITIGTWHERETQGADGWAIGSAHNAFGRTYLGRTETPRVYEGHTIYPVFGLSDTVYYEYEPRDSYAETYSDAVPMVMEWTYQPVWGAGQRVFHDRLEIVVQTGVGNADETDPVISLEASDDGGQTWTSLPDRAMGAQGKTFQRVVWHNLGASYQRVYRASVSDPVPVRVMSTELTARGGRA